MARLRASQKQEHREAILETPRLARRNRRAEHSDQQHRGVKEMLQVLICWHPFVRIEEEGEEKDEEKGRGCVCPLRCI